MLKSKVAVASDERIEAYLLYVRPEDHLEIGNFGSSPNLQILALRSFIEDGGARLKQLLSRLGMGTFCFSKVHPAEISKASLETLGFRAAGGYLLYTARARSE